MQTIIMSRFLQYDVNRVLGWYNRHGEKEFVQHTFFVEAKNEAISTLKSIN